MELHRIDELLAIAQEALLLCRGPWEIGEVSCEKQFSGFTNVDAPQWDGFMKVVTRMHGEQTDCEDGLMNLKFVTTFDPPALVEILKTLRALTIESGAVREDA